MSSMLALGLSLDQVIRMVTCNAAAMLGLSDEIGALKQDAFSLGHILSF